MVLSETVALITAAYGNNYNAFFYRPQFDLFITKELCPLLEQSDTGYFPYDRWQEKNPFNFPGPFYTGQSDTCGTGEVEAPDNVLNDAEYKEFIFKQPRNFTEFAGVLIAGMVEVFDAHSCNGNNYWTYDLCRRWWAGRHNIIEQLKSPAVIKGNGTARVNLYIDYLQTDAENDLRKYCYFLETGTYPDHTNTLPIL